MISTPKKLHSFAVEISELFQKTVVVKAMTSSEAIEDVRRRYFHGEIELTVDSDFIETQFELQTDIIACAAEKGQKYESKH